jgi:hypothetical protein
LSCPNPVALAPPCPTLAAGIVTQTPYGARADANAGVPKSSSIALLKDCAVTFDLLGVASGSLWSLWEDAVRTHLNKMALNQKQKTKQNQK